MSSAPVSFPRLLVTGASTRWAAQSLRPFSSWLAAADWFGDRDTRAAVDQFFPISSWNDLREIIQKARPDGMIPLGGLENHPELLADLARSTQLLGSSPTTLAAALDPSQLQRVWGDSFPAIRPASSPPPVEALSEWLWKPVRSAGGLGVRVAIPSTDNKWADDPQVDEEGYYQQRLPGPTWGATFLSDTTGVRLLGVCRQLNGPPFTSRPFVYAGSIGPLPIAPHRVEELGALAVQWHEAFPVRGLFGIDIMGLDDPHSPLRAVDLNLRPPASAELIELACGKRSSLMADHVRGCGEETRNQTGMPTVAGERRCRIWQGDRPVAYWGKAIWYVPPPLCGELPTDWEAQVSKAGSHFELADCPLAGTKLESGQPGFTIRLRGSSPENVFAALTAARETLEQRFSGWLSPSSAT